MRLCIFFLMMGLSLYAPFAKALSVKSYDMTTGVAKSSLLSVESMALMGDVGHTQLVIRLPQKTYYEISSDDSHQQVVLSLYNIDPTSVVLPVNINNTAIQNLQYNVGDENQLELVLTLAPNVDVQGLRMIGNNPTELVLDVGIGDIPYVTSKSKPTPGAYMPLVKKLDPLTPDEIAMENYTEAVNLLGQNNAASAILLLQTILTQQPDFEEARVTLAEVFLSQNQPKKALNILSSVNYADISSHTDYYATLAETYRQTGSLKDAANLYQDLITINPNNAIWWAGLGMCLQSLNQAKAAHAAYVKADNLGNLSLSLQEYVSKQLIAGST